MAMKSSETTFTSDQPVAHIGRRLQGVLATVKAQVIDEITNDSGALSAFDDRADIQVVAQGQTMLTGQWAVQIFVVDQGLKREITLVALGDSGFTKVMYGGKSSAWLSTSTKKRDEIKALLR